MRENGERGTDAARKEDKSQAVGLDGDRADAVRTNNPATESSLLNGPLTASAHRNEGVGLSRSPVLANSCAAPFPRTRENDACKRDPPYTPEVMRLRATTIVVHSILEPSCRASLEETDVVSVEWKMESLRSCYTLGIEDSVRIELSA